MVGASALEMASGEADSHYSWWRLVVSFAISAAGGIGFWSAVVVLPAIEAEFDLDRSQASLPYTGTMIGLAIGGILMGRLSDRFGVMVPVIIGILGLTAGYVLSAQAETFTQFFLAHAILIGMFGCSVTLGPLIADVSLWFKRRRGIAVAIVASGNYSAGTLWSPLLQSAIDIWGWREAYFAVGVLCFVVMLPLALMLRRRPLMDAAEQIKVERDPMNMSPSALQALLIVAGLCCCIAMSMPQVHLLTYCIDLGFSSSHGANILALMLGLGVASRLTFGMIADRIGGVGTLLLSSSLQCLALAFYIPFNGLTSLYIVSGLFGLFQGGIVPSYALIVRQYFPASEAGARISLVLTATIFGMALGGWMSGEVFDLTGSYPAAFLNGILFNLINISIAWWLLIGRRRANIAAV
jgi:MFS family permease